MKRTCPRRRLAGALAALLALFLVPAAPARALDTGVRLAAYHHDIWTAKDGAPREIESMAQSADGWLWLGTMSGLYRFDGVTFRPFVAAAGERLLGKRITALAPGPDGALWIGYASGGMSVLRAGHLQHVAPRQSDPVGAVYAMAFERDGSLWVAAGSKGLLHYRGGAWIRSGAEWDYPAERAEYVYRDHYDRLWASDGRQVYLLDRGARRFAPVLDIWHDPLLLSSPDGRVWVADGRTVQPLPAPAGGWRPLPRSNVHASSYQSLFDREGNFWVGNCPIGLCRLSPASRHAPDAAFADRQGDERLDQPLQMSGLQVRSMLEDREGNVWAGTISGLDRFRPNKLIRVPFPPTAQHITLAADGAGAVWAATERLDAGGQLWQIRAGVALAQPAGQDVNMVAPGKDGTVLIGGTRRIERRRGADILASYPLPAPEPGKPTNNNVVHAADDGDDLWIAISGRGLYRRHAGAWLPPAAHPQLRGTEFVTADTQGRMWFGLRDNRLAVRDGGQWRTYGAADGIAVGAVRFIDARVPLVIGGDNGLAVLKDDRFTMLAGADDGALSGVTGSAATADGDRWLNTQRGLLQVRRADWERSMLDPSVPLRTTLLDTLDGYPGSAESNRRQPSAFVAGDGKVWVAGTDGAAWLDPANSHRNGVAPPVEIESVAAGGQRHPAGRALAFGPGTDHLQIDYTALSYTMPERVRFRYRLLGADRDWQDAGTRRAAYYTNLGPGAYRFEVAAVNEDGVAGAVVRGAPIEIAPRFVQTRWFAALCVLLGMLAAYLLYLLRLAQVTRQLQTRMEARMGERTRIARTLHDTFLQSLQGLILRLDAMATRAAPDSDVRGHLDHVVTLAGRVLDEGRDRVLDLRAPEAGRPLHEALADAAEALRVDDSAQVAVRASGLARQLPSETYDEVLFVAREAIANALRHARARHVDVVLDWTRQGLGVTVRDDGVGLTDDVLAHGRPGHWGLTGMRERAQRIGAALAIRNRTDGRRGTEVVLHLALPRPKSRWLRRTP